MLDNLKIKTDGEKELMIPLKDIHSLIIDNYKLVLSVQLLNKCAENNINVITCGADHNPVAIVIPHNGHHQMALVIRNQLQWDEVKRMEVHKLIVQQKIRNQCRALLLCGIEQNTNFDKLLSYIQEVTPGDITNREGLAAKVYFRLLFGPDFKRFESDVINAGLNYGYTIFRSQINKVVVSKGLLSSLGIIHKGPANMFNLSDDVIEPFRPIIDVWVYNHLRNAELFTKENRLDLVKLTTHKTTVEGQKQTIFNAMVLLVDSLIEYFDGKETISFPTLELEDDI